MQCENSVLSLVFNNRNKCRQLNLLIVTIGESILNLFKANKFQKSKYELKKQTKCTLPQILCCLLIFCKMLTYVTRRDETT